MITKEQMSIKEQMIAEVIRIMDPRLKNQDQEFKEWYAELTVNNIGIFLLNRRIDDVRHHLALLQQIDECSYPFEIINRLKNDVVYDHLGNITLLDSR